MEGEAKRTNEIKVTGHKIADVSLGASCPRRTLKLIKLIKVCVCVYAWIYT